MILLRYLASLYSVFGCCKLTECFWHHACFLCFCRPEFSESILPVHPSDVLDMPVDPNEPTYCLCHQVSYGEMIGCDNPDVRITFCFVSIHEVLFSPVFNRNSLLSLNSVRSSGFTSPVLTWRRNPKGNGTSAGTKIGELLKLWGFLGDKHVSLSCRFCPRCTQDRKKKWVCMLRDYVYIWIYV